MDEKTKTVTEWLNTVYKYNKVPYFEVNSTTVDILYELAIKNQTRDADWEIEINDLEQKTLEYKSEANRLSKVLDTAGISMRVLNSEAGQSLRALTDLALLFELNDIALSSYFMALSDFEKRFESITQDRKIERELASSLQNDIAKSTATLIELKRVSNQFEEQKKQQKQVLASRSEAMRFMESKKKRI